MYKGRPTLKDAAPIWASPVWSQGIIIINHITVYNHNHQWSIGSPKNEIYFHRIQQKPAAPRTWTICIMNHHSWFMMRWLIKHTLLKSPTMVIASPQEMLVTLSAILCLHRFAHITHNCTDLHILHRIAEICKYLHRFTQVCHFFIPLHCVSSDWPLTAAQPVDQSFNYDQGHHVGHCLRIIYSCHQN